MLRTQGIWVLPLHILHTIYCVLELAKSCQAFRFISLKSLSCFPDYMGAIEFYDLESVGLVVIRRDDQVEGGREFLAFNYAGRDGKGKGFVLTEPTSPTKPYAVLRNRITSSGYLAEFPDSKPHSDLSVTFSRELMKTEYAIADAYEALKQTQKPLSSGA